MSKYPDQIPTAHSHISNVLYDIYQRLPHIIKHKATFINQQLK